jgi:hypothetical protein
MASLIFLDLATLFFVHATHTTCPTTEYCCYCKGNLPTSFPQLKTVNHVKFLKVKE